MVLIYTWVFFSPVEKMGYYGIKSVTKRTHHKIYENLSYKKPSAYV
jgi:hypothetical protein